MNRYGVYAAVFLYKARCAGAFHSDAQSQEAMNLALKFAAIIGDTTSSETHVRRKYSRMLRGLFRRQEPSIPRNHVRHTANQTHQESPQPPVRDETIDRAVDQQSNQEAVPESLVDPALTPGQDIPILPSMEDYPFGPFLPELVDASRIEGLDSGLEWPMGYQVFDLQIPDFMSIG